jgi:hypothetical protein
MGSEIAKALGSQAGASCTAVQEHFHSASPKKRCGAGGSRTRVAARGPMIRNEAAAFSASPQPDS